MLGGLGALRRHLFFSRMFFFKGASRTYRCRVYDSCDGAKLSPS